MNKLITYFQATRPFSFTVSFFPPLLSALFFIYQTPLVRLNLLTVFFALLGAVSAHASANLISDYFDFKNQVDRPGTAGSSGVLILGKLQPKQVLKLGISLLIFAACIAIWFVLHSPIAFTLTVVILIGALLAVFYTFGPLPLKYKALGDIAVFIAFGPAMSFGAYVIFSDQSNLLSALILLPPAFLVTAVLHANNTRDIQSDSEAKIKTIAMKLGKYKSLVYYRFLLFSSYLFIIPLVLFRIIPVEAIVALFSFPLALKLMKIMKKGIEEPNQELLITLDAQTAQLHALFSLLYSIGFLVRIIFF